MQFRIRIFPIAAILFLAACTGVAEEPSQIADESPGSGSVQEKATVIDESTSTPIATTVIRLGVFLTPQELETFQPAIEAIDQAHPEWDIELELTPQQGISEKVNTELAANNLPDVLRLPGLSVHQWIRQDAFLDLTPFLASSELSLDGYFPGPLEQFQWQDKVFGLPDTAAPDVLFYNKDMFDAAGMDYPTNDWTYGDMRQAALMLTLDDMGRSATDPSFNADAIEQWGWNGGLTFFWQRHLVRPFGGDFCVNDDCTLMRFTDPETIKAADWWAEFTHRDYATLYDPYGGSQTGIPGDPFLAGKAAMGYNGFFAVGQLNDAGNIDYDIIEPLLGEDGHRYTPLSTNGYVIAANSAHPQEAWELIKLLTAPEFLKENWGKPGHSVPALREAASSVINPNQPPANQQAIVDAMSYAEVFKPFTGSAFEVYGRTAEFFTQMMKGEITAAEAMAQIEAAANEVLAVDRP